MEGVPDDDGGPDGVRLAGQLALVILPVLLHLGMFFGHLKRGLLPNLVRRRSPPVEILPYVEHHFLSTKLKMLLSIFRAGAYVLILWIISLGAYAIAVPEWVNSSIILTNAIAYGCYMLHLLLLEFVASEQKEKRCAGCGWLTETLLSVGYGYVMLYFLFQQATTEFPHSLRTVLNMLRLLGSAAYLSRSQALVWNLLILLTYLVLLHGESSLLTGNSAVVEVTWFCIIVFFTHYAQLIIWDTSIDAVVAKTAREEQAALEEILSATCDAVVKLDDDLNIAKEDSRLSALLMGHPTMLGTKLEKYLDSSEDREVFRKAIATDNHEGPLTAAKRPGVAGAFVATLRDMIGNRIQVQIFHARLMQLDGKTSYLIGVSERHDPVSNQAQDHFESEAQLSSEWETPSSLVSHSRKERPKKAESSRSLVRRTSPRGTPRAPEVQAFRNVPTASDKEWAVERKLSRDSPETEKREDSVLEQTSDMAMEWMMLEASRFWNFEIPRGSCCYFHAAGRQWRRLYRGMAFRECSSGWPEALTSQCPSCGLLLWRDETECCFCEANRQRTRPVSSRDSRGALKTCSL